MISCAIIILILEYSCLDSEQLLQVLFDIFLVTIDSVELTKYVYLKNANLVNIQKMLLYATNLLFSTSNIVLSYTCPVMLHFMTN